MTLIVLYLFFLGYYWRTQRNLDGVRPKCVIELREDTFRISCSVFLSHDCDGALVFEGL